MKKLIDKSGREVPQEIIEKMDKELKEKRDKLKYCCNGMKTAVKDHYFDDGHIHLNDEYKYMSILLKDKSPLRFRLNYCPFCGMKLEIIKE